MQVQPYLFLDGKCDEALTFYKNALGAEVTMLMRYKESPEPHQPCMIPPGAENKVMHSAFRIGDTLLMASDGRCQGKPTFQGMALSLTVANDAEAERLFAALGAGGQVQMPMNNDLAWSPTVSVCHGWLSWCRSNSVATSSPR